MKTYACGKCGSQQTEINAVTNIRCCGSDMNLLDGVIRGGGVMAIWRDGKEVWSGTGLEAVELLQKLIHGGIHQVCEQAAEADRITRALARVYDPSSSFGEAIKAVRNAQEYVAKYPKT